MDTWKERELRFTGAETNGFQTCDIARIKENPGKFLGWAKNDWLLIITVYTPKPPKWIDPKTRGGHEK